MQEPQPDSIRPIRVETTELRDGMGTIISMLERFVRGERSQFLDHIGHNNWEIAIDWDRKEFRIKPHPPKLRYRLGIRAEVWEPLFYPLLDLLNSDGDSEELRNVRWVADQVVRQQAGQPVSWPEWVEQEYKKAKNIFSIDPAELPCFLIAGSFRPLAWFFYCLKQMESAGIPLRQCPAFKTQRRKKCGRFFIGVKSSPTKATKTVPAIFIRDLGKRYCSSKCSANMRARTRYFQALRTQ